MSALPHISDVINKYPLGKRQYIVLIICGILMILDGFDVQSISYAAPAILQEWQIEKAQLGTVFGAGLFGLFIGSLVFSYLSDKLGRRPVLLWSTLFFAICMIITAFVQNIEQLIILRFITGLGLGAIMPNAMALCGEITPQKQRVSVMMFISCGFTVGAMLGGFLAAFLIPHFGWQSVFLIGGIFPAILVIFMLKYIPESLQYMVLHRPESPKIHSSLAAFYPGEELPQRFEAVKPQGSMPVKALFEHGRHRFTFSIWTISLLNMIALYFLSSWLPTLAKLTGMSLESAVLLGATLQLGGTVGTILMGLWIDRVGFHRILVPCYLVAAAGIALLGGTVNMIWLFFIVVFIIGFTVIGGQPAINAMAADFYPTEFRTTGVGWSLAAGRIGSIIGPVLGGWLMQNENLEPHQLFYIVAVPSVFIVLVFLLQKYLGIKHTS
ncbi:MFS transporter [Neisseria zalophi]|uniref:MFS transporter n=2 Tax=Neisseria zalophi TaxID=640030 RepID=A0A5J6Q0Z3_9NEIS|nr:MFS transporter [Neisseria zalophi]